MIDHRHTESLAARSGAGLRLRRLWAGGLLLGCCFLLAAAKGCGKKPPLQGRGVITLAQAPQGIYTLTTDDSLVYHPLNLPAAFLQDSLEVFFAAVPRSRARIAGMPGLPIEVKDIVPVRFEGAALLHRVDDKAKAFVIQDTTGHTYHLLSPVDPLFQLLDTLAVHVAFTVHPDTLAETTEAGLRAEVHAITYADPMLVGGIGKVTHQAFEGGFYGLKDLDGHRYLPEKGLPEAFCRDGIPVRFLLRRLPPSAGFQMWGRPVELLAIKALD